MEEVRPWCGQPSDREQLYDRTEQIIKSQCVVVCVTMKTKQTVYWILAASKGWIKQTYRKIMHAQNTQCTQNHITGNDLVQIE